MCGCDKHLKRRAKCTCVCPEHANFQAAYDLAMSRMDAIRDLEGRLEQALTAGAEPRVEVTAETVWQIADGLRKRFAVSNGTQVWVEYQGSAESLADSIREILDEAVLTTQPAISAEQLSVMAQFIEDRCWCQSCGSGEEHARKLLAKAGLTVAGESDG